uniref:NADH dehydrogenase subunit 6 n=1 Tax=Salpa fusiformis TaxID=942554 RepID=A0A2Z5U2X6_9UROC|nr:NADH dehydrogenase subunit 6 [Salpa fusiformis]
MFMLFMLGVLMLMLGSDFLSMIFLYFMTVIYCVLSSTIGGGGISPYLFMLLFSGGMLIFLLFCSLLYNNKVYFNSVYVMLGLVLPMFLLGNLSPLHIPILSYSFNFQPLQLLIIPSILLFIMSIGNIEVALRN